MLSSASVLLGALAAGATAFSADFHAALTDSSNGWHADTGIFLPNDEGFADATYRWSVFAVPTYNIAITPATEEDVATAVRLAREYDVPFLATGGRHGISTTLAQLQGGFAIDLSLLNTIEIVDQENGVARVGGGAHFGDGYDPIFNSGWQLPVGASPCPGFLGATIGGGIGREQGIHGLVIDNLIEARVVTAAGDIVVASAESNPDLFWAIRGAGANFGIVTYGTYKLRPLVNNGLSLNADFIIPGYEYERYFDIIGTLEGNMPAELGVISIVMFNETSQEAQLIVNWVYFGPEEEGLEIIAPVLELDTIQRSVTMVPWNRLVTTSLFNFSDAVCLPGGTHAAFGLNFRRIDTDTYKRMFRKMTDFYAAAPDAAARAAIFELEVFSNDEVLKVGDEDTAYPWRDSTGLVLLSFGATELAQRTVREIRAECVATSGYDDLRVYSSVAHGDETLEQLFGPNVPRLRALKKVWDPENVFGYMHGIPPATC